MRLKDFIISGTVVILGGIPRLSINKIHYIRLSFSIEVRRPFLIIKSSRNYSSAKRRYKVFQEISHTFAAVF